MHKHKLPICPIPPNAVAEMTYIYIYIYGVCRSPCCCPRWACSCYIAVSLPYISDFWHQVVRKGRTFSCYIEILYISILLPRSWKIYSVSVPVTAWSIDANCKFPWRHKLPQEKAGSLVTFVSEGSLRRSSNGGAWIKHRKKETRRTETK